MNLRALCLLVVAGCAPVNTIPDSGMLPVDAGFAPDGATCALLLTTTTYIPDNPYGSPAIAVWIVNNPSLDLASSAPCSSQSTLAACQDFWSTLYQDATSCVSLTMQGLQGDGVCCTLVTIQNLYARLCHSPTYTSMVPGFGALPDNPCAGPEPTR